MKAAPAKSCPSCSERYDADVLYCPTDGTPLVHARVSSMGPSDRDPYLGVELPGQIRLEHLVGIGSMGRVYRAFQGGIERHVAVKILHRELSANHDLVARFHREAKVASRLVHPNVVQVLMTGSLPLSTDPGCGGELYLVMEYLDGVSLLSVLAAAGVGNDQNALPLPRALHIALQICDAVGEAHAQGIVHRDLKPENVMLIRRGDDPDYVKVLDFGIARLDWAARESATQAGLIFGTAKYISPEGAEGLPVEPPADVYSIATIVYQMLAGRTPFEGDSPVALLVQHTHAPPAELRSITRASYVPAPLAVAVMQNLAKKPGARAPTARAFGRDLIAAARASGLYPEEIASQSTWLPPSSLGAVKLVSRERTRSHELSSDLASKIGGVAAEEDREASAPLRELTHPTPTLPSVGLPSERSLRLDSPEGHEASLNLDTPFSVGSLPTRPMLRAGEGAAAEGAPFPASQTPLPPSPTGVVSTMQGTETSVDDDIVLPTRALRTRTVALLAILVMAVPLAVIIASRQLGIAPGSPSDRSLEAVLDEARDAERRHAWDTPPGHNFRELTNLALASWPESAKVRELRREAADRILADALGRKYANDLAEALHLVRIALELNPELTAAQHLATELSSSTAQVAVPPPASSAPTPERPKGGRRGRDVKGRDGRSVATAAASAVPRAHGPATEPSEPGDPTLPQDPSPPDPSPPKTTPRAASSSQGPWL